jgi:hypothetical protein
VPMGCRTPSGGLWRCRATSKCDHSSGFGAILHMHRHSCYVLQIAPTRCDTLLLVPQVVHLQCRNGQRTASRTASARTAGKGRSCMWPTIALY